MHLMYRYALLNQHWASSERWLSSMALCGALWFSSAWNQRCKTQRLKLVELNRRGKYHLLQSISSFCVFFPPGIPKLNYLAPCLQFFFQKLKNILYVSRVTGFCMCQNISSRLEIQFVKLYSNDFMAVFLQYLHISKVVLAGMCLPNTGVQACYFRNVFLIPVWDCISVWLFFLRLLTHCSVSFKIK